MSRSTRGGVQRTRILTSLAVLGAAAVAAAACGGGSSKSTSAASPAHPSASPAHAAATVTIETHSGPVGTYLTDGSGRALYLFAADKGSTSTCYGQCAKFWPPLVSGTTARTTGGAQAAMVGTTSRTDGSKQVTYDGHPLYYFLEDKAPGDIKGQGLNASGGFWWLLAANGSTITTKAASPQGSASPSPSHSSSSSGGGGGY
jgi:predicted lipoprotein with Yx(FWY)xxD motif